MSHQAGAASAIWFPDHPQIPPAMLVEALAQLAGRVAAAADGGTDRWLLAGLDGCSVPEDVGHGAPVELACTITRRRHEVTVIMGVASQSGHEVARGTLVMARLTIGGR